MDGSIDRSIAPVVCHCMDQSSLQLLGVLGLSGTCFPKITPSPSGSSPPRNTNPFMVPNGISIGSAVFVWVPNAMLYNALSVGKKTPKIAHSPWDFVTLPEEDRAATIDKMHKNLVKIACAGASIRCQNWGCLNAYACQIRKVKNDIIT